MATIDVIVRTKIKHITAVCVGQMQSFVLYVAVHNRNLSALKG